MTDPAGVGQRFRSSMAFDVGGEHLLVARRPIVQTGELGAATTPGHILVAGCEPISAWSCLSSLWRPVWRWKSLGRIFSARRSSS
jgi:hypothetical protein